MMHPLLAQANIGIAMGTRNGRGDGSGRNYASHTATCEAFYGHAASANPP